MLSKLHTIEEYLSKQFKYGIKSRDDFNYTTMRCGLYSLFEDLDLFNTVPSRICLLEPFPGVCRWSSGIEEIN